MKPFIRFALFALALAGCATAQNTPFTNITLYGTAAFRSSSGGAGGSIQGGPISAGAFSGNGLTITGFPFFDAEGIIWGDGTSNPMSLYFNSTSQVINFTNISGSQTSVQLQNGLSNGDFNLIATGIGTARLESNGGGVLIKAQSFGAGYHITLDGNVIPGNVSPWGYAQLGDVGFAFQQVAAAHFISDRLTFNTVPSRSLLSGAGSGATSSLDTTANDASGIITVNTGTVSGTGDVITISFAESYTTTPHVLIVPANQQTSNGASYVHAAATTTGFTIFGDSSHSLSSSATYQWTYWVVQ